MEKRQLSREEKRELLGIARQAVASRIEGSKFSPSSALDELQRTGGAFVTIHKKGSLRGCIGIFESDRPIYDTVSAMAVSAAINDPRFSPVSSGELEDLDFEISVLSPLREIKDVGEIKVGTHGIFITKDSRKGVLLPQVAMEYNWDRETFLEHTCLKADLAPDAWREGAKIEIFTAQVFGEKQETE